MDRDVYMYVEWNCILCSCRWLYEQCTCMFNMFCSFNPYQDNTTAMCMASQEGHHGVVLSLLGAGADINITRSDVGDVMFNP